MRETFFDDGHDPYLDCGDAFVVYICLKIYQIVTFNMCD